jgi:four helix bundle protein
MSKGGYKDLIAWQKGMSLVVAIYDATEQFPSHEQFGLVSQLRRAAVSVPGNIAEGKAHYSNRDFVRFLRHARGLLVEIETQILIAEQRRYLPAEMTADLTQRLTNSDAYLADLSTLLASGLTTRDSGPRTNL